MKVIKRQIRSAQNVDKVLSSKKKSSWPHLGQFQANFSMDRENAKKHLMFASFPWWANGLHHQTVS